MSYGKKRKKNGNKAGGLGFGITFIVLASIFKIHGLIGLGVILAVSSFVSSIIRTMAQGLDTTTKQQKQQQADADAARQVQEAQEQARQAEAARREAERRRNDPLEQLKGQTGSPDVDALLSKGREMIEEIRAENAKIPDEGLSRKLEQLEAKCTAIFHAVYEKPAKASQIRKFMDYYLPTTLKMVKNYRILGERNLSGKDVLEARRRIEDALGVVNTGCQKMLDNLYKDDVLDITTDIDVLEQMLKRDGLTESDLAMAAEQAKQAAKIDLAAKAAQEARRQAAASVPTMQTDSGVKQQVASAQTASQQHMPQAPTISGGMYPAYGDQAQATKPE